MVGSNRRTDSSYSPLSAYVRSDIHAKASYIYIYIYREREREKVIGWFSIKGGEAAFPTVWHNLHSRKAAGLGGSERSKVRAKAQIAPTLPPHGVMGICKGGPEEGCRPAGSGRSSLKPCGLAKTPFACVSYFHQVFNNFDFGKVSDPIPLKKRQQPVGRSTPPTALPFPQVYTKNPTACK